MMMVIIIRCLYLFIYNLLYEFCEYGIFYKKPNLHWSDVFALKSMTMTYFLIVQHYISVF